MTIRVGAPFKIKFENETLSRDFRKEATDEIMYQIAKQLPVEYRGIYADVTKATTNHLSFTTLQTN